MVNGFVAVEEGRGTFRGWSRNTVTTQCLQGLSDLGSVTRAVTDFRTRNEKGKVDSKQSDFSGERLFAAAMNMTGM